MLANLVLNAGEAMSTGEGQIVVALREVPGSQVASSPLLSRGWTPEAGSYACLEVSDNGSGMDSRTLQNVFDPFFTTKFTGRGLGLPVVLGVVRAHHGTVTVDSQPRPGEQFPRLPAVDVLDRTGSHAGIAEFATPKRPAASPRSRPAHPVGRFPALSCNLQDRSQDFPRSTSSRAIGEARQSGCGTDWRPLPHDTSAG